MLADREPFWRFHERFDGGKTRQSLAILDEGNQEARMVWRAFGEWILGDDGCEFGR